MDDLRHEGAYKTTYRCDKWFFAVDKITKREHVHNQVQKHQGSKKKSKEDEGRAIRRCVTVFCKDSGTRILTAAGRYQTGWLDIGFVGKVADNACADKRRIKTGGDRWN
ncbi:hypothetical protein KHM83_05750 [Fusibacter paucivorans]|uniref:Uncharacterized protein n=1 Tax=Fusibacter paucivorans TaxID=76009 RepID=A0ABS5PQ68_9FIRM|nr:hypothetical protein [Fusibacter paucivorans]MBS7526172.1 hypothetical protein [Fusibacter paucivorans]